LPIGPANDRHERHAETAAAQATTGAGPRRSAPFGRAAPPFVHEALGAGGSPLDPARRRSFEAQFDHNFSGVRLHMGDLAARSAMAVDGLAYTDGEHIVLGQGTGGGPGLLEHELAQVVQQRAARAWWVQRQPTAPSTPAPGPDYAFIMGADPGRTSNPFYTAATNYFKARLPSATMVSDRRSLAEVLDWIAANVQKPIGDVCRTTLTAVADRVLAKLHHESLDASKHDPFVRPESDADFFATSTVGPPTPVIKACWSPPAVRPRPGRRGT
jgi:hypothetical protein